MYSGRGGFLLAFLSAKVEPESRAGRAPSPAPRTRQAGCPRTSPCQRGIRSFFFSPPPPAFFFNFPLPREAGAFPGSPAHLPARPRRGAQGCGRGRGGGGGGARAAGSAAGTPAEGGGGQRPPCQPCQPCPPRAGRTPRGLGPRSPQNAQNIIDGSFLGVGDARCFRLIRQAKSLLKIKQIGQPLLIRT